MDGWLESREKCRVITRDRARSPGGGKIRGIPWRDRSIVHQQPRRREKLPRPGIYISDRAYLIGRNNGPRNYACTFFFAKV